MGIVDAIAIWVGGFVVVAMGVWCLYTLIVVSDKAKGDRQNEPEKPAHDVAIPANTHDFCPEPETDYIAKSDHFEPYCAPKRTYIKRSKYWTDKRKKAAAAKARKTKRKSK